MRNLSVNFAKAICIQNVFEVHKKLIYNFITIHWHYMNYTRILWKL